MMLLKWYVANNRDSNSAVECGIAIRLKLHVYNFTFTRHEASEYRGQVNILIQFRLSHISKVLA